MSTADVARAIGRTVSTVNRMVSRGEITPAAKAPGLRGSYLFDPAEVERLAAERKSA